MGITAETPRGSVGGGVLAPLARALTPRVRAQRVTMLLAATLLLAVGDLYMTLQYVTTVGMVELNPIARLVMAHDSAAIVVLWKLATTLLGLGILFRLRERRMAELGAWVCFLALALLAVHWLRFSTAAERLGDDYLTMAQGDSEGWVHMDD